MVGVTSQSRSELCDAEADLNRSLNGTLPPRSTTDLMKDSGLLSTNNVRHQSVSGRRAHHRRRCLLAPDTDLVRIITEPESVFLINGYTVDSLKH